MTPSQSVQAHTDLGNPTLSVGIHWGTFMTSSEPYLSPLNQLNELDTSRFITSSFGETILI